MEIQIIKTRRKTVSLEVKRDGSAIVHELAHRRHRDHSALFWAEVERYCPEYADYREQLKKYQTV